MHKEEDGHIGGEVKRGLPIEGAVQTFCTLYYLSVSDE